MNSSDLMGDLTALVAAQYPTGNFDFLADTIYEKSLTLSEIQNCFLLIDFARSLQTENPIYEPIYHQILHLFVLNGSRLHLVTKLDRRIRGLVEGQSALVFVSGNSGMGKTSLVMAFQERIKRMGVSLIIARCSEQESTSYAVWHDVVRSLSALDVTKEAMLAPIGTGLEAKSSQQLKQALKDWLTACTHEHPLVILLDDLHWADADSLEMLNYLTDQPQPVPILFVATYRSEEAQVLGSYLPKLRRNRQVDTLLLSALSANDVERLVTAYLGACRIELVDYLQQRADGHPLFTVELLNDLKTQGLLSQDSQGLWLPPTQSAPVPTFLRQLIMRRVNRLGSQVEDAAVDRCGCGGVLVVENCGAFSGDGGGRVDNGR